MSREYSGKSDSTDGRKFGGMSITPGLEKMHQHRQEKLSKRGCLLHNEHAQGAETCTTLRANLLSLSTYRVFRESTDLWLRDPASSLVRHPRANFLRNSGTEPINDNEIHNSITYSASAAVKIIRCMHAYLACGRWSCMRHSRTGPQRR